MYNKMNNKLSKEQKIAFEKKFREMSKDGDLKKLNQIKKEGNYSDYGLNKHMSDDIALKHIAAIRAFNRYVDNDDIWGNSPYICTFGLNYLTSTIGAIYVNNALNILVGFKSTILLSSAYYVGIPLVLSMHISRQYYKSCIFKKLDRVNKEIENAIKDNLPIYILSFERNRLLTIVAGRKTRKQIKKLNKLNEAKGISDDARMDNDLKLNELYNKASKVKQSTYNKIVATVATLPVTVVVKVVKTCVNGVKSLLKRFFKKESSPANDPATTSA